jgi:hypothetical protein
MMIQSPERLAGHDGRDLVQAHRRIAVVVHAGIPRACVRVVGQAAVAVHEEMPSAVVSTVPYPQRVVAEHDEMGLAVHWHLDTQQAVYLVEQSTELRPHPPGRGLRVVVAKHQADAAGNGIAMTPTLHRLFDAGLSTLVPRQGAIIVERSPQLHEQLLVSNRSRLQLENGMELLLPSDAAAAPTKEFLSFHREQAFLRSA